MRLSIKGAALIGKHEGFESRPYNDPTGHCTIGYGHLIHRGGCSSRDHSKWGSLSVVEANALMQKDADRFEDAINRLVKVPISQDQFDALTCLVYNIGEGRDGFAGSTLLRKLNAKDYDGAQAEFHRWVRGKGKRLPGLVKRRAEEAALFGSKAPSQLVTDPLTDSERKALDRLAYWRRIGRRDGWGRHGKPTEAKIAAEEWKRHITAFYVKRIEDAAAKDRKRGRGKREAWTRFERQARRRLLLDAVNPRRTEADPAEPKVGAYPRGLPKAYRKHWDKPWTVSASRSPGFRKWLDGHGYLTPHLLKREAGSKDGVSVDEGGVNRAARDHAFNLEKLRHALGDVPMEVISWFRSWAHNRRVGGAKNSQHPRGLATDHARQWVEKIGRAKVARAAEAVFRNGGVGTYPAGSMHFDSRGSRARWSSFGLIPVGVIEALDAVHDHFLPS
jgi:lysozyme